MQKEIGVRKYSWIRILTKQSNTLTKGFPTETVQGARHLVKLMKICGLGTLNYCSSSDRVPSIFFKPEGYMNHQNKLKNTTLCTKQSGTDSESKISEPCQFFQAYVPCLGMLHRLSILLNKKSIQKRSTIVCHTSIQMILPNSGSLIC